MIIKRLDADQLAAFRFTKPCEERFLQLQSELLSIAHSNSDVLAKERIEDAIREISQRLTELEKPLSPEGADEDKDGRRAAGRKKRAEQLHAFIVMLKKETEITTGSEKLINLLAEFDTGEIPALGSIIRRLTLGRALELVRHSIDLEKLQVAPLSPESLSVMAELMEHVIVKEGLPSFALSSKASKRLKQLFSQRALLDDMARLQGMQTKGMEEWLALPTRGLLAELSGSYSDTCWNSVRQLVKGHPNITAVPFVRSPNTPLAKLIGSTLLIEGRSLEGDQVLIIRGINPLQNHIMRVQAESFFEAFVEWLAPHAKRGGFTKILIPGGKSGGSQTNRPPLHAYIQEKYGNAPVILLADDPPTTFNGYDIRSSCLLVRELTQ
ncbi:MAG: hypothetical protein DCC75_01845 [Proteobacteria bacterium]|nr:MAG: hypothetical protein DCC75_01845 [Pseudomonadota bacterium]